MAEAAVEVEILEITDRVQPLWVKCLLVDSSGVKHYFQDKLPIFALNDGENVPCKGAIRCQIVHDERKTVVIDTSSPDGIESTAGNYIFEVLKNQLL